MGAISNTIRDALDTEMTSLVGAAYTALTGALKDKLFTAIGNAIENNIIALLTAGQAGAVFKKTLSVNLTIESDQACLTHDLFIEDGVTLTIEDTGELVAL